MKKITCFLICLIAGSAHAALIAEYDYNSATSASNTSLTATTVSAGYTATALTLNNASNTASVFGNHFYHNGWDTTFNTNKYYEATISNSSPFTFSNVAFSLESITGTSTFWLRSSSDGFTSDISTGNFSSGLVTDFSIDLSSLGIINSPETFRWYIAGSTTSGFANHHCGGPGWDAGCGLTDVGVDLSFHSVDVDEPATLALLGLGLAGLGFFRRKTH